MIVYYNPFTICYHTLLVLYLAFRGQGEGEGGRGRKFKLAPP